jgi:hypothetical protein
MTRNDAVGSFHIVHIMPTSKLHILNGYNDVIKTVYWGLRGNGHEVSYATNHHRNDATNIVFGANMAHISLVDAWPADTIIYNLEQISPVLDNPHMRSSYHRLSERFTIWDYSEENIKSWRIINENCAPKYVPIGYAKVIDTIPKPEIQDIDILIYGGPSANRLNVFNDLCSRGVTALFCFGLYDKARDDLIARSKLVLNVSHDHARIFSIVRVSHLLANRKAVIADLNPDLSVEPDMFNAVQFAPLDRFVETCLHYLRDDNARIRLESQAHRVITQRNIHTILAGAMKNSGDEK